MARVITRSNNAGDYLTRRLPSRTARFVHVVTQCTDPLHRPDARGYGRLIPVSHTRSVVPVNLVRRCLLLVLVLGTALWPSAAQAATKGYTLNIASAGVVGTQVTYNATFKVLTNQQQLGSANLTPPAGFRNVTASTPSQANVPVVAGVIQLRNLALPPGATLVVTVKANISCTSVTSTTWTVQAKQANDFNGVPGNDLTLDTLNSSLSTPVTEACSQAQKLRFASQPANASTSGAIPGSAGSPVSVQVLDGAGHPVTT